ncbi:MAG: DUF2892 domain-containing protein [Paenirhodobacter sp.]|uniref:YgaP family membrane protein n=1 Tax=Paenirhodobacter sp. TaxID=1965326 RepID=UPI003D0EA727
MFKKNEGNLDRILRIVVGLVLIGLYLVNPAGAYNWLGLIGIIPLVTGLLGSCPINSILGINTCPMMK